jgi:hypothetical protein
METHVALLAACLPTLRQCLGSHRPLESVLRSLRTTISLSSLKSVKSRSEKGKTTRDDASSGHAEVEEV